MYHYKINTFWSKKDNAFVGVCPEFEGLAVVGKTREEAFKEAEAALQDYIEIYQEDGIPLPTPIAIPEYSGQVRLRMSRFTHQKAVEMADLEGVSLNTFLNNAIESRIGKLDQQASMMNEIREVVMRLVTSFTLVRDEWNFSDNRNTASIDGLRLCLGPGIGTFDRVRGK